jgi:transposase
MRTSGGRDANDTSWSITLGLPIAGRVEPAGMSGRRGGARLLAGLAPLFPRIQTVIADAGHESRKLALPLLRDNGWKLQIVKRRERVFRTTGLTWIADVCVARAQTAAEQRLRIRSADLQEMIDSAAIRLMLNRFTAARTSHERS